MIKYLCAILFGIILFLLLNRYDGFSVGIPLCPSITSQYTNSILDWSTDQNPYGTPMITDTHHYIIQGTCDMCQTVATTSYLSAMYNIRVYEWFLANNIDCDRFQPIIISPRSIIDLILYDNNLSYSECPADTFATCGLLNYFSVHGLNDMNSIAVFRGLITANTNGDTSGITRALVKYDSYTTIDGVTQPYSEIIDCPPDGFGIYNIPLEVTASTNLHDLIPDYNVVGAISSSDYKTFFNPDDLLYINIHNNRNIIQDLLEGLPWGYAPPQYIDQIDYLSGASTDEKQAAVPFDLFVDTLSEQLKLGPIIWETTLDWHTGEWDEAGVVDILNTDDTSNIDDDVSFIHSGGGHAMLIIGYETDHFIVLNSWNPYIATNEPVGDTQYYITHRITKRSMYDNFQLIWDRDGHVSDFSYMKSDVTLKQNEIDKLNRLYNTAQPPVTPPVTPPPSCEDLLRNVNNVCCDEPGEDCSSGYPTTCNSDCKDAYVPFYDQCSDTAPYNELPANALAILDNTYSLCTTPVPEPVTPAVTPAPTTPAPTTPAPTTPAPTTPEPVTPVTPVIPCSDDLSFRDEVGQLCSIWTNPGFDCDKAVEDHYYTPTGQANIISNCPVSCGLCPTTGTGSSPPLASLSGIFPQTPAPTPVPTPVPVPVPTPVPTPTPESIDINTACTLRFDISETGDETIDYNRYGARDIGGDGTGSCCRSVQDINTNNRYQRLPILEATNVYNYIQGCYDGEHIRHREVVPVVPPVIANTYVTTCNPTFGIGQDMPCNNYYTSDVLGSGYHICKTVGSGGKNKVESYTCTYPKTSLLDCDLVDPNNDEGGCKKKD